MKKNKCFAILFLFLSCAAGEGVELSGHDGLHELENMVACAMAGVEMGVGVIILPRWMYEE